MSDQKQKAGDNSVNLQANTITISQGPSVSEVRAIALDVFRANFLKLTDQAKDIAAQRAEEITEKFLGKLEAEHPTGLTQAQDPDFQYALYTVQKEYARCGEQELGDLLVDLLADRSKHDTRSIMQIVLTESLSVAPKLTKEQLSALSIIFLLRYTRANWVRGHSFLSQYLDKFVAPFASAITDRTACYQHLEYSGCGKVELTSLDLTEAFRRNYGGLFSKGFSEDQVHAKQFPEESIRKIIAPCINDQSKQQLVALCEEEIRALGNDLGLSKEDLDKLVNLHYESLMNADEIRAKVIEDRPFMDHVFRVWNESPMKNFSLTSVGISIGHANTKKITGEFADLNIWIN